MINIHVPTNTVPKYMKQKLRQIKGETGNSTIIETSKILLSIMDKTIRQDYQ